MDYRELYFNLFNKITDAIELLSSAQVEAEEKIMDMPDPNDEVTP